VDVAFVEHAETMYFRKIAITEDAQAGDRILKLACVAVNRPVTPAGRILAAFSSTTLVAVPSGKPRQTEGQRRGVLLLDMRHRLGPGVLLPVDDRFERYERPSRRRAQIEQPMSSGRF